MPQITIDIPEELERKAKMLNIKLSLWVAKVIKEQLEKQENDQYKIARVKEIAEKSKASEKDAEELAAQADAKMLKHYKNKYGL